MFEILRNLIAGAAIFGCLTSTAVLAESVTILPGEIWPDQRGQHIQAHGGGILKLDDTWYWFGEDRGRDRPDHLRAVSCYSSKDLANWTFRNRVFATTQLEGISSKWVLERPKVYHNKKTGKFVMYMHIDGPPNLDGSGRGYGLARVGIATCDTVDGNYTFVRSFRPLEKESRDIGQFIDDDGQAYLVFECRPEKGFYIAKLSEDYMDVEKPVCLIQSPLEGGALVKYEGLYYIIGSALTGWRPNPNKFSTAPSLAGPWTEFQDIAPPETNTYGSQSTMMVKVTGDQGTTVIYMGDQWRPEAHWDSRYLWMPLEIGGGKLRLPEPKPWTLNVKSGEAKILAN